MRHPGSFWLLLIVFLIGMCLAGALSWGIYSYWNEPPPGPKGTPAEVLFAIGLGFCCAGWALWQLRLPTPKKELVTKDEL
jgi:drug/metabolite transporter (DMT)-like permease